MWGVEEKVEYHRMGDRWSVGPKGLFNAATLKLKSKTKRSLREVEKNSSFRNSEERIQSI